VTRRDRKRSDELLAVGLTDLRRSVESVEGWLSDFEVEFLYRTARACRHGVVLEIGSFKGKSTICLAKGSQAGSRAKVYAVDPHVGTLEQNLWLGGRSSYDDFALNIARAKVEDLVVPLVQTSQSAAEGWDRPIGFLWIDGDHSYSAAKRDFELFFPWVVDGGTIAFHDATTGDVPRVVYEEFRSHEIVRIGLAGSVAYGVKFRGAHKSVVDKFLLHCIKHYDRLLALARLLRTKQGRDFAKQLLARW
jgi:predicted O-methyltransferase YrrM